MPRQIKNTVNPATYTLITCMYVHHIILHHPFIALSHRKNVSQTNVVSMSIARNSHHSNNIRNVPDGNSKPEKTNDANRTHHNQGPRPRIPIDVPIGANTCSPSCVGIHHVHFRRVSSAQTSLENRPPTSRTSLGSVWAPPFRHVIGPDARNVP